MNRRKYLAAGFLFALAGCSATAPVPEDRFYRLQVEPPAATVETPVFKGALRVDTFDADPLRSGRAILFREQGKPLQLQRYHYEFWVEQPPKMLHQELLQYLRSSGIAKSVQDGSGRQRAIYRVTTRLLRFERVLGGDVPRVEIELEVSLTGESSGKLLWTKRYFSDGQSKGGDLHAMARAMQQATGQVFSGLLGDLKSTRISQ